jgi:hypothetical protein
MTFSLNNDRRVLQRAVGLDRDPQLTLHGAIDDAIGASPRQH